MKHVFTKYIKIKGAMHLPQRLDPSTRDRINAGTLARVHANQIVTFHDSDW